MVWTREQPKKGGWYFFQNDFNNSVEIVKISITYPDGLDFAMQKEVVPCVFFEGEYKATRIWKGWWSETAIEEPNEYNLGEE